MAGLIDDYLVALRRYLRGTGRAGRRLVKEAEAHMRESADELAAGNAVADAEQQAIAQFGPVDVVGPELCATATRRLVARHAVQSAIILPLVAWLIASYAWSSIRIVNSHGAHASFLTAATIVLALAVCAVAIVTALHRNASSERTARRSRAAGFLGVMLLVAHAGTVVNTFSIVYDHPLTPQSAPLTWTPPPGCPDRTTLDTLVNRSLGIGEPLQPLEELLVDHCYWEPSMHPFWTNLLRGVNAGLSNAFDVAYIAAAGIIAGLVLALALTGTAIPARRDRRRLASVTLA
ncbi:MAG: permease prefix domain 1-containing protein [Acidimicrobiia bacterium]